MDASPTDNRYSPDWVNNDYVAETASIRVARDDVAALASSAGVGDATCEDLRLLVSELVTNAIQHTPSARVAVACLPADPIRVRVEDEGHGEPLLDASRPLGGWGMRLVAAMTTSWGVDVTRQGKIVWFDLPWANDQSG